MQRLTSLLGVLLIILAASGCSSIQKRQKEATVSIEGFHQRMNAEESDKIYDEASDAFQKAVTREQWRKMTHTLESKLGRHVSSAQPAVLVNWTTNGTFVKATCESKFDRAGATETFNFIEKGDKLQLLGYNVNSAALLQ